MNEELKVLGDEYWEWQLEVSPTTALLLGDHRYGDQFDELSREAEDRSIDALRAFARRAEAIDPSSLSDDERISREVLIFEATTTAADLETRQAEFAVNHVVGFHAALPAFSPQLPIETPEHAEQLVGMYRELGRAFGEMNERIREGVASERTPPRHAVAAMIHQLDALMAVPPEQDPLLSVRVPGEFDEHQTTAWKERLRDVIVEAIRPTYAEYRALLEDEVMPVARPEERSGVCWLPDGEELYARAIHRHTSLPMDAAEIHEIGLQAIESLADEYRVIGSDVLGTTDLSDIFSRLRDDPDLHFTDGPAIVAAAAAAMGKARAEMADWFGRLPVAECALAEVPSGPKAFYFPPATDGSRPGTYFLNTAEASQWGLFELEATSYHEAIPGHHFQLAIAQELENVPEFRKHARITAYGEGWGLYTERLADEMGLYGSGMDRLGMLALDSMRAGRLVVDTGIHAMGWSRRQAIEYMERNSPTSLTTIEDEIDRYIGIPGQALSYMIGRLEIQRIRADAEERMGDDFDIKGFHDAVLTHGMLPLQTLAGVVDEWAAS